MNDATVAALIEINRAFYGGRAGPFDRSRQIDQPGFQKTLAFLPAKPLTVLDIGCGNGRYGSFLARHDRLAAYTGLDFSSELLEAAAAALAHLDPAPILLERDMAAENVLSDLDQYALIVCLSALQHLPQSRRRIDLLAQMKNHLAPDGHILLGNWQFNRSERQRRKIRPWSAVGLAEDAVEPGDYLLTWQRGGLTYRYACLIDEAETNKLAAAAGLTISGQFLSDGREGDLNLYTILGR